MMLLRRIYASAFVYRRVGVVCIGLCLVEFVRGSVMLLCVVGILILLLLLSVLGVSMWMSLELQILVLRVAHCAAASSAILDNVLCCLGGGWVAWLMIVSLVVMHCCSVVIAGFTESVDGSCTGLPMWSVGCEKVGWELVGSAGN